MKKIRRHVRVYFLVFFSASLLIIGICLPSLATDKAESDTITQLKRTITTTPYKMASEHFSLQKTPLKGFEPKCVPLDSSPAIQFEYDQIHPALARTSNDIHMAAYRDNTPEPWAETVFWTWSVDDGQTYDPSYALSEYTGGDYPALALWEGIRFFGTMVTDPFQSNGGDPILVEFADPANTSYWYPDSYPYSAYNWRDMIDADIACDNSQNDHEWGICSYVMSFDGFGDLGPYSNGPTILYADPQDPNGGVLSWYRLNHTQHTHVAIDQIAHEAYMVYDYNEDELGEWSLLVWLLDFEDPMEGVNIMYEIDDAALGNLKYPAVAVHDNQVVILCQTDTNGNQDILCLSGDIDDLTTTIPFDTAADETYPEIHHIQEQRYVATWTADGQLYKSITNDGGQTWEDPTLVDSCVEEYKTCDISEQGRMALYEKGTDDVDIWIENDLSRFNEPEFKIDFRGGLGITVTFTNKDTATTKATNVNATVQVTGGILGQINQSFQGFEPKLSPGESYSIKTNFFFGFGKIIVAAQVSCDEGITVTDSENGRQFIILSLV